MSILRKHILVLLMLSLTPSIYAAQKELLVDKILKIKSQNETELSHIESEIKLALVWSDKHISPQAQRDELKTLLSKRSEMFLRREFLSRLVGQTLTKFKNGADIKAFYSKTLHEMAYREALNSKGDSTFWQFLSYLSSAFKNQNAQKEEPIKFISSYMQTSTIGNPLNPEKFFNDRHYTNGVENIKAKTVAKENVGDELDSELQNLDLKVSKEKTVQLSIRQKDLYPRLFTDARTPQNKK